MRAQLFVLAGLVLPLAAAAQPARSAAGGLPACTASLEQCRSDLAATRAELAAAKARIAALEAQLAACGTDFDACLDHLASCESGASCPSGTLVPAKTGGTATSADGAASVTIPAGALARDTTITIRRVAPAVDAARVSDVFDFGPDGQQFSAPATVCLKSDAAAASGTCLGYLDEKTREWKCEDECLKEKGNGTLCGETSHFTNFAILLSGSSGKDCGGDATYVFSKTGGTASSADGAASVTIPAGALAKDTTITVRRVAPAVDAARASDVFDFGPDGLLFSAPATVCLKSDAAAASGTCLGYLDEKSREWKCEDPCLKEGNGTLCGETSHFTNFAILLSGSSSSGECRR